MNIEVAWQLKLTPSLLDMDFSEAEKRICRFIKEYGKRRGLSWSLGGDDQTILRCQALH
jgi:hypothetical protein